jgi:hypothetical protein
MKIQGAVIEEQGITFAIVIVKKQVLDRRNQAEGMIREFQPVFGGVPVVLMAQDHRGLPRYYGRKDIARYMADVPVSAVPWREYTISGW